MSIIDKLFESKNLVYHYTKAQTAYEFILNEMQLRFSYRKNSKDPLESLVNGNFTISSNTGYEDTKTHVQKDLKKIKELIKQHLEKSQQVCFCLNDLELEYNSQKPIPLKYYGFLKSRMWDQYGDNYNGICIVFDLDKLKELNPEFESNVVNYEEYEHLFYNKNIINTVELYRLGEKKYIEAYFKKIEKKSFLKHIDYSGEKEYRFITFSDQECFLKIKGCIKAIIIPEGKLSKFAKQQIEQYETIEIPIYYLRWKTSGIVLTSKKEIENLTDILKKQLIDISRLKNN